MSWCKTAIVPSLFTTYNCFNTLLYVMSIGLFIKCFEYAHKSSALYRSPNASNDNLRMSVNVFDINTVSPSIFCGVNDANVAQPTDVCWTIFMFDGVNGLSEIDHSPYDVKICNLSLLIKLQI